MPGLLEKELGGQWGAGGREGSGNGVQGSKGQIMWAFWDFGFSSE